MSLDPRELTVEGDFALGRYPSELSQTTGFLATEKDPLSYKQLTVTSRWFDLTLLCHLACLLRSCQQRPSNISLRLGDERKCSFFWRSGFFSAANVGRAGSPFEVYPDIWKLQPADLALRLNFSSILVTALPRSTNRPADASGYKQPTEDLAEQTPFRH